MHNAIIFILYKGVFPLRETPLYSINNLLVFYNENIFYLDDIKI